MRRFHDQPLLSPSDLNDLLECRHLMALKLAAFEKRPGPRPTHGAHTEILVRYGEQHEQAILERFEQEGRSVERIETGRTEAELESAIAQTTAAMRRGVEVIHQAALVDDGIGGYADFLERVDRPSQFGDWSYEVSDAKLARIVKTYFLVQLSAYAGLIDRLQGHPPEQLAVLLGNGERDEYRSADFAAYVRALRDHAQQTIAHGLGDTYPLPCSHCGICGYRRACEQRREADDHLSLVAGLRRDQIARLEAGGVPTLTALAELPAGTRIERVPRDTLYKLQRQAALQLHERRTGEQTYEFLPYLDGYGFGQLPEPAVGDLYFDIEGDPYIGDKGLEYLFGVGWLDEDGKEAFRPFWAHDRAEERASFEQLMDFFMAWLADHPGSHIYHYAAYEEQALKTLSMWHGTREQEVDHLLRSGALGRPLPRRAPGHSHLQAQLLAETGGVVLLARARGQGEGGRRLDRGLRALAAEPRPGGAGRDRALQHRGRALHAWPARLAAGAAPGADRYRRRGDLAATARRRPKPARSAKRLTPRRQRYASGCA